MSLLSSYCLIISHHLSCSLCLYIFPLLSQRSVLFWYRVMPLYLHYVAVQKRLHLHEFALHYQKTAPDRRRLEGAVEDDGAIPIPQSVARSDTSSSSSSSTEPTTASSSSSLPSSASQAPAASSLAASVARPAHHARPPQLRTHLIDVPDFLRPLFDLFIPYLLIEGSAGKPLTQVSEELFRPLHEVYADDVLNIILELRGYYIKLGQMGILTEGFLPPAWIEKLEALQNHVPHEPFSYVRGVVERDLGRRMEDVFTSFDEVPLGAASIGQTHKAVLKDGREVVVKVQYTKVEQTFAVDMKTIKMFCRLAQPEQLPFLDEVRQLDMTNI